MSVECVRLPDKYAIPAVTIKLPLVASNHLCASRPLKNDLFYVSPFRYSTLSGSLVLWCVVLLRFSPRKFTVGLPESSSLADWIFFSSVPSFRTKLFILAHASIKGSALLLADATVTFLQRVLTGFSDSAYANMCYKFGPGSKGRPMCWTDRACRAWNEPGKLPVKPP